MVAERFKFLRGSLLLSKPGSPPRVVLVTGPDKNAGKTFVACNLAMSLTDLDKKVLIIDADLCRAPSIVVPAGSVDAPRMTPVEFDLASAELPWEERRIVDGEVWRSFPARVRETAGEFLTDPMLDEWWPIATERAGATNRVGAALAQARHRAELEWGCRNLELPQSELCRTAAFRWFVAALLADLKRLDELRISCGGQNRLVVCTHGFARDWHTEPPATRLEVAYRRLDSRARRSP